jgi:hypothetical protein
MSLTFDHEIHEYRWNGEPAPSVTQILESAGLIDYSYIPEGTRAMALERGSAVHAACHYDDEGDLIEDGLDALMPYVNAWRKFRADTCFAPDLIEHRAYHEQYGYAGTLDRRGTSPKWKLPVMVDLKNNDSPRWAGFQLAAYAAFFPSPRTYMRLAVELHKDGTYRVDEYFPQNWSADFSVFLAALTVMRAKEMRGVKTARRAA